MKKFITLLFALLTYTIVNAQIIRGDMDGDGKLTMTDANQVANSYLNNKAGEALPVYRKEKVDTMYANILSKLERIDSRLAKLEKKSGIEDEEEPIEKDNAPQGVVAVDLGLSVRWASCNIGATTPEGYGDYFAWGETTAKSYFDWASYKYCNGSSSTITKYCTNAGYGTVDNKTVLDREDDAAAVNWGGKWRMPTYEEQAELRNTNNCTWTVVTKDGVTGFEVKSKKNGNSIFLPCAGYCYDNFHSLVETFGYYWSSSLSESDSSRAYDLDFFPGAPGTIYNSSYLSRRIFGSSVRAVCP